MRQRTQVVDLVPPEFQIEQVLDRLLQSSGNQEIAVLGQPSHRKLKRGNVLRFSGCEIASRHGQLIEVGVESGHAGLLLLELDRFALSGRNRSAAWLLLGG